MSRKLLNLAVTGWDIISSIGIGKNEFSSNLLAAEIGKRPLEAALFPHCPLQEAGVIKKFDKKKLVGKKGTRGMDRLGAFSAATLKFMFESDSRLKEFDPGQTAFILSTSTGSMKSQIDFITESLTQESPDWVDPLLFPKSVMNCAAGQVSIWHKLTGPNTTLTGGYLSGYLGLRYAFTLFGNRRCKLGILGSVEDFCSYKAWKYHNSEFARQYDSFPGEACVMLAIEQPEDVNRQGITPLATILDLDTIFTFEFNDIDNKTSWLIEAITGMLERSGLVADKIDLICTNNEPVNTTHEMYARVYDSLFTEKQDLNRIAVNRYTGDCQTATVALQLASILALYEKEEYDAGSYALMLTEGDNGALGCALLKKGK